MSFGSSPPGCDVLISSLKTPYEFILARSIVHVFRNHLEQRLQVNSCECLPRKCVRLTRFSILSMAHISSAHGGDRISLKRFSVRPTVHGFHLPCSLRQLSKSKLSPSVRTDSTMKSSTQISFPSSGTPTATVVALTASLRLCCKRQSSTHFRGHTDLHGSLLLCLNFPSLSGQQVSFSRYLRTIQQSTKHCIFHCDRVVHTPKPRVKVKGQIVTSRHDQKPKDNLRLWSTTSNEFLTRSNENEQRVPHSFRPASRPVSQPTFAITKRQATNVLSKHRTRNGGKGLNSAPLPCLPCICSVSCATLCA